MSQVIRAIYEKGVFRPLQKVDLPEHHTVEIHIISEKEWKERFHRLISKIHKISREFPPEEIEADISQALKEARSPESG